MPRRRHAPWLLPLRPTPKLPYGPLRRRAARMLVDPAIKAAASRKAGLSKLARHGLAQFAAMGRLGGTVSMSRRSPEVRSQISRRAGRLGNLKRWGARPS